MRGKQQNGVVDFYAEMIIPGNMGTVYRPKYRTTKRYTPEGLEIRKQVILKNRLKRVYSKKKDVVYEVGKVLAGGGNGTAK